MWWMLLLLLLKLCETILGVLVIVESVVIVLCVRDMFEVTVQSLRVECFVIVGDMCGKWAVMVC